MECFDVCLKMPISKITSVLNAKDDFITLIALNMFWEKNMCSYCLTQFSLIYMKISGGGGEGLEGTLDLQARQ